MVANLAARLAAPLAVVGVLLWSLAIVFSRSSSTISLTSATGPSFSTEPGATVPFNVASSASSWADVSLHDLRTMVSGGAMSFEAYKAEIVRRMAHTISLEGLGSLNRQLGAVMDELQAKRALGIFRTPNASAAAAKGTAGGAGVIAATPDAELASERPPVVVSDGLATVPAPGEALRSAPPISDALLSAIKRAREAPGTAPVNVTRLLPTLIFIGNPKCGSTFLWDCVRSGIFDPTNVCGPDSSKWRSCNRGFLITAFGPRKEFNFYDKHFYNNHGWEWYVGPEVDINLWERTGKPWQLKAPRRMDAANRQGAFTETCRRPAVIDKLKKGVCKKPSEHWRCEYFEACAPIGRAPFIHVSKMLLDHAFPRRADLSPFAMAADPSINYFIKAGPQAMRWMYEAAIDPPALRFILLMRDPLERTYSNWLMFRQWNWEDQPNFTQAAADELFHLKKCDPETFERPKARLPAMSTAELDRYHAQCIIGPPKHLLNHVRGSMYVIGALQWFKWFSPSQFLVLDNDEVRTLKAEDLLSRIARHAGLHLELSAVPNFRSECEGLQHSGDPRKHYHKHKYAPEARTLLRNHFRPYNEMLYERLPQLTKRWPDQ